MLLGCGFLCEGLGSDFLQLYAHSGVPRISASFRSISVEMESTNINLLCVILTQTVMNQTK